jgi:hypothetical protein
MDIKKKFIELTSFTYPYGYEDELVKFLPNEYLVDEDGNYLYEVGSENDTIFACHLDTACKNHTPVIHKFDGKYIRTDKKTILGADDKAGMVILLYMIAHNVPGLYYFFIGEEVGCIGSTAASRRKDFFSKYKRIISFDRRGVNSIITHQSSKRTCSDEFANSISKEFAKHNLNLEKDDTGVYTDSAEFAEVIPECTNISVGYYKEHTTDEHQDIEFLEKLAKACVLIDWRSTEVKRDPSKAEWKEYSNYYYYGGTTSYSKKRNKSWQNSGGYFANSNGFYGDGFYGEGDYKKTRRSKKGKKESAFMQLEDFYYGEKERYVDDYKEVPYYYYYVNGKKVYYNSLDNEITNNSSYFVRDDRHNTDYYAGVKKMYLDDNLTREELKIIEEQCLDMNDSCDRDFLDYMEDVLY